MIYRKSNSRIAILPLQSLLRLSIIVSTCVLTAMSMPYMALDMRNPKKCVQFDYSGTQLEIVYDIFDPNKDRMTNGIRTQDTGHINPTASATKVTIDIFPPDDSSIARNHENHLTETVSTLDGGGSGKLKYKTDGNGMIHVCAQVDATDGRRYPRPTLFGMRIKESGEYEYEGRGLDQEQNVKVDEKGQAAARMHLSEMEHVLVNMIREINLLLKNADAIKDEEAHFHQMSVEMNSASRWWPMMHVVVLLVTGFTQANHIIKFFKSMHII